MGGFWPVVLAPAQNELAATRAQLCSTHQMRPHRMHHQLADFAETDW